MTLVGTRIFKAIGAESQKYSTKWFEYASDELLNVEREYVRKKYCSAGDDYVLADRLQKLLYRFDMVIRENGEEKKSGFLFIESMDGIF